MRRALRQVRHAIGIFSGDDDSLSLAATSWPNAATPDFRPSQRPQAAASKRSRPLLAVAVAAGVLALAGGLWALLPPREAPVDRPAPPPPPPTVAAPASVGLKLASAPDGAVVFVDGARAGLTPVQLDLAPGRHALRFEREGHLPATLDVDVPAQAPPGGLERAVTLEAVPPPPPSEAEAPAPAAASLPARAAPPAQVVAHAPTPPAHAEPPRPAVPPPPERKPVTPPDDQAPKAAKPAAAIRLLDDPDGAPAKPATPPPAARPTPGGAKIDLLE
jgi:hypothetical protein